MTVIICNSIGISYLRKMTFPCEVTIIIAHDMIHARKTLSKLPCIARGISADIVCTNFTCERTKTSKKNTGIQVQRWCKISCLCTTQSFPRRLYNYSHPLKTLVIQQHIPLPQWKEKLAHNKWTGYSTVDLSNLRYLILTDGLVSGRLVRTY